LLSLIPHRFLTNSVLIPVSWSIIFVFGQAQEQRRRDRYFLPLSVAEEIIAEQRQLTEATCDAQLCAAFAF
jgi:hypothetical protein